MPFLMITMKRLSRSFATKRRPDKSRVPIEKDGTLIENNLVSDDWRQEVLDAIDRGAIKKADTLEELAEKVGLDPDRFVAAVKRWNEVCETGEDTDLAVPYNSEWLVPLKKPPYYCAKIGAMIGKTLCGLRVDENMHVLGCRRKSDPRPLCKLSYRWRYRGRK